MLHRLLSALVPLFLAIHPTDIPRGVVAAISDSAKLFAFWSESHVGKKVPEIHPTLADFHASATVTFPAWSAGVTASLDHGAPRGMSWIGDPSATMSVKRSALIDSDPRFAAQAPAAFHEAAPQVGTSYATRFPAAAAAEPFFLVDVAHNCKASESFFGHVL
jgi:hypothetical protein